jgi:hypothetical protein
MRTYICLVVNEQRKRIEGNIGEKGEKIKRSPKLVWILVQKLKESI